MKPLSFALAVIALATTACSAWQQQRPGVAVNEGSSGSAGYTAGSRQLGAGMLGDQDAVCELNRRLKSARSPDERQAMMDQFLPDMSPEMREWHLKQMQQRCE